MGMAHVLVAGYLSIDSLQAVGAVPVELPGGAALYAALGARHAGAQASIAAAVGEDYPQPWLQALAALGIDVSCVQRRPGPTRRTVLRYRGSQGSGQRDSLHYRDAIWWQRTQALAPTLPDRLRQIDVLVACPMPIASLAAVLQRAALARVPVVADTSEAFVTEDPQRLLELVGEMMAFAPSREETRLLWPLREDDDAASALASFGVHLLHKRGAEGALALTAHGAASLRIAAPPTTVVDPTGAGDATVGALAAYIGGGTDFLHAAAAALLTGALATTATGPAALGLAENFNPQSNKFPVQGLHGVSRN